MNSKVNRVSSLYVWTQISGTPVIVGRFEQTGRVGSFYYANSYIDRADAFAIDPINLPLIREKEFVTQANGGVFGVLLDAGPDKWGQKVLSELSASKPRNPLEFLLAGNGDGCGTLLFSLSRSGVKIPKLRGNASDIDVLERGAHCLLHDERVSTEIKAIMVERSSMGGARPKASIIIDEKHYIAKFNRDEDLFNEAVAEKASLNMAAATGIKVAPTRIMKNDASGRDVLLTQRFDFDDAGHKMHYISANSLMNMHRISENDPDAGYPGLAGLIRQCCANPKESCAELFKRMSLRVLMGDTDDHAKNLGFLYNSASRQYSHSPMFDVLPHVNAIGLQAMPVGILGRQSSLKNLLSMTESFGLSKLEASDIIRSQLAVLVDWRDYFRDAGMSETEIRIIEPCFHLVSSYGADKTLSI
jgi:serine/threonine-protein kinase HipA